MHYFSGLKLTVTIIQSNGQQVIDFEYVKNT